VITSDKRKPSDPPSAADTDRRVRRTAAPRFCGTIARLSSADHLITYPYKNLTTSSSTLQEPDGPPGVLTASDTISSKDKNLTDLSHRRCDTR
jgi:hypothetical protein